MSFFFGLFRLVKILKFFFKRRHTDKLSTLITLFNTTYTYLEFRPIKKFLKTNILMHIHQYQTKMSLKQPATLQNDFFSSLEFVRRKFFSSSSFFSFIQFFNIRQKEKVNKTLNYPIIEDLKGGKNLSHFILHYTGLFAVQHILQIIELI